MQKKTKNLQFQVANHNILSLSLYLREYEAHPTPAILPLTTSESSMGYASLQGHVTLRQACVGMLMTMEISLTGHWEVDRLPLASLDRTMIILQILPLVRGFVFLFVCFLFDKNF